MLLHGFPQPLFSRYVMVKSDYAEERLARVEQMMAQYRRHSAPLTAVAVEKITVTVDAAPSSDVPPELQPAPDRRSNQRRAISE